MRKAVFAMLLASLIFAAHAQTTNFFNEPYIEVNGKVDTLITPNEIYIKIIISERDTRDKTSVEEQEGKMVDALKSIGINTEEELTTSDMASNFKTYLFKGKDVLKTKEYQLKVTNAVTASKVFMQLEDLNISNTSIDHVDYSEMESLRNLMRSKAVENAKARAVALTKPLNQSVGAAIRITDDAPSIRRYDEEPMAEVVVTALGRKNQATADLPKIEFKKIKVAANVEIKFVLK